MRAGGERRHCIANAPYRTGKACNRLPAPLGWSAARRVGLRRPPGIIRGQDGASTSPPHGGGRQGRGCRRGRHRQARVQPTEQAEHQHAAGERGQACGRAEDRHFQPRQRAIHAERSQQQSAQCRRPNEDSAGNRHDGQPVDQGELERPTAPEFQQPLGIEQNSQKRAPPHSTHRRQARHRRGVEQNQVDGQHHGDERQGGPPRTISWSLRRAHRPAAKKKEAPLLDIPEAGATRASSIRLPHHGCRRPRGRPEPRERDTSRPRRAGPSPGRSSPK